MGDKGHLVPTVVGMGDKGHLVPTDAKNKLEDLSGIEIKPGDNPYETLIKACDGDPRLIQSLYSTHRIKRNSQQKEKFLSSDFREVLIDEFLLRIENPGIEPGFRDPRHCLVLWARPPNHILELASHVQSVLRKAAPTIWLMPTHRMHMTTLEITHSQTPDQISALASSMKPAIPLMTNFTYNNRSCLVKPMVCHDLAAVALSFLPAAGEAVVSPPSAELHPEHAPSSSHEPAEAAETDSYTYHHLRKDMFDLARGPAGVEVQSRYVVPSAHITLGRFLSQEDHAVPELRMKWIQTIEEINTWLESEIWGKPDAPFVGEWIVGQERGLEARCGPLWYGAGRSLGQGEGF